MELQTGVIHFQVRYQRDHKYNLKPTCIFTSVTQYQKSSKDFTSKSEGSHLLRDLKRTVAINIGGSPRHKNWPRGTSSCAGCCRGRRLHGCVCKTQASQPRESLEAPSFTFTPVSLIYLQISTQATNCNRTILPLMENW